MVESRGVEPRPLPCKGNVLPLSLTPHNLVALEGVEPSTVGLEHLGWNPPAELYGADSRNRTDIATLEA